MLSVPQATAMSLVAGVIKDHFRMEALMSQSVPDQRYDYAEEWMDYEDYRDATQGGCGFPWESDDEDEATEGVTMKATEGVTMNGLAIIAVSMIYAMTQDADYVSSDDWIEFLGECFGNGFAMEFVMSSWQDGEFRPY